MFERVRQHPRRAGNSSCFVAVLPICVGEAAGYRPMGCVGRAVERKRPPRTAEMNEHHGLTTQPRCRRFTHRERKGCSYGSIHSVSTFRENIRPGDRGRIMLRGNHAVRRNSDSLRRAETHPPCFREFGFARDCSARTCHCHTFLCSARNSASKIVRRNRLMRCTASCGVPMSLATGPTPQATPTEAGTNPATEGYNEAS